MVILLSRAIKSCSSIVGNDLALACNTRPNLQGIQTTIKRTALLFDFYPLDNRKKPALLTYIKISKRQRYVYMMTFLIAQPMSMNCKFNGRSLGDCKKQYTNRFAKIISKGDF